MALFGRDCEQYSVYRCCSIKQNDLGKLSSQYYMGDAVIFKQTEDNVLKSG